MNVSDDKTITFRFATLKKLMQVVEIEEIVNYDKFKNWFNYKYDISEQETSFFSELIKTHIIYLSSYNEISLTIKFIGPILNKVKFITKKFKDWYGYKMESKLNNYTLKGEPDLIIATGIDEPEIPYFFLQEYKKTINSTGNPKYQVLAEMLAAISLNKSNIIRGSYIIGQYWKFIILEKLENGSYEYFISESFDSLKLKDLIQIYINLQAVKALYCK